MSRRSSLCLALALLVGAGILLVAQTALAAQALVNIYAERFFSAGVQYPIVFSGSGTVTVGTGATPSVMVPSGIVSGMATESCSGPGPPPTGCSPYTATIYYSTRTETYTQRATTLRKSWPNAAPSGGSTFNAGTGIPAPTTICFVGQPPAVPKPGSCDNSPSQTRFGSWTRAPGAKKYGGTLRVIRKNTWTGQLAGLGGRESFSLVNSPTAMLTGTPTPAIAPNQYGHLGDGRYTQTIPFGATRQGSQQWTYGPNTTGTIVVKQPVAPYTTTFTMTGSNNLNPTNLTGTISLIRPVLFQAFSQTAGTYTGRWNGSAGVVRVKLTFLPEPGGTLLLGCGVLAIAGLSWSRRR